MAELTSEDIRQLGFLNKFESEKSLLDIQISSLSNQQATFQNNAENALENEQMVSCELIERKMAL